MWRSRARALLLRCSIPKSPPPPPPSPLRTLPRVPPARPLSRFLSSSPEPLPDAPSSSSSSAASASADPIEEGEENLTDASSSAAPASADPTAEGGVEENLASLWEEDTGEAGDIFAPSQAADAPADEEVARVRSVLEATPEDQIPTALADMVVDFTEPLLAAVLRSAKNCSGKKLLVLFKSAAKNNPAAKSRANLRFVLNKIAKSDKIDKMDVYLMWDLIKEMGDVPGSVSTRMLNRLISMLCKLEKPRAALEVLNKFSEFGCTPDVDSYYLVIQTARKKSMVGAAWGVCEKMISSGCFPDGKKVGVIMTFLCSGKKAKEAHSLYMAAREKKVQVPTSALDFLVGALSRKGETITMALALLEEYQGQSLKYAGKTFAAVINGLCRTNNVKDAKKLLMRMVNLGPAPGNTVFNSVITALSKEGEMEDAKGLLNIIESRGLQPDIYTYTVIMSGYTKGGMIDDAHALLHEAKKIHPKLSSVTYHILIRGYCKIEEFDKALECLKEMKKDGLQPNVDEYNKLIQSLCLKAVDWQTAEKLLDEMKDSGLYLKGITHSLVASVKELAMEEESKIRREA